MDVSQAGVQAESPGRWEGMGCVSREKHVAHSVAVGNASPEDPGPPAAHLDGLIGSQRCLKDAEAALLGPRLHRETLSVEVVDEDLISTKVVADDEARDRRIHDPVQNADTWADDRSQVGVEVYRHHGLGRVFAAGLDPEKSPNMTSCSVARDHEP